MNKLSMLAQEAVNKKLARDAENRRVAAEAGKQHAIDNFLSIKDNIHRTVDSYYGGCGNTPYTIYGGAAGFCFVAVSTPRTEFCESSFKDAFMVQMVDMLNSDGYKANIAPCNRGYVEVHFETPKHG